MGSSTSSPNPFSKGAQWIRADREFKFTGDDNFYNSSYVDALVHAGIRLGIAETSCMEERFR